MSVTAFIRIIDRFEGIVRGIVPYRHDSIVFISLYNIKPSAGGVL